MSEVTETFGAYGGRYVPETLIPALDELTEAWDAAKRDPAFQAELDELGRTYVGRPVAPHPRGPLRPRQAPLPEARGPEPHRRAQDQQRARPGRARAAAREAAHHRRDRRRPARRRDRHGLRTLRARMHRLHGLRGHAPAGAQRRADATPGRRGRARRVRHPHAEGGDERRDPRLDRQRRDDALRDRLLCRAGPVPRARPRAPVRHRQGGARAAARGGGRAPRDRRRVRRRRLERDRHVRGVPRRRRGPARRRRGRRRRLARDGPRRRSCTARARPCSPTRTVRSRTRTRSPPVSTTRASAPSTPGYATPAARRICRAPTTRRLPRLRGSHATEGIVPALESAHALAVVESLDADYVAVCLSGRGDKDLAEALAALARNVPHDAS